MAQKFNIVAQLQLQGPSNLNRVVSQIQSKLQNVNAQVNFQINKNAAQNVQAASNAANNLSKSSAAATKQVGTLSKASKSAGSNAATSAKNTQQALPEGSIANANVTDKPQVADVNTSTDDIIRDAMAEAGIN